MTEKTMNKARCLRLPRCSCPWGSLDVQAGLICRV